MKRRAFTIVELCAVIGVIAALLGLLLPALATVNSTSRSTKCQLNLRQMAVAAQNYAAVFDHYPIAVRYENINGSFRNVSWDYVSSGNQVISPGALWMYTNNPDEILQCPDYHGPASVGEQFTGYNYNTTYVGGEALFPNAGWKAVRRGVSPHACRRGSHCAMFGDAGRKNGSNRYMRAPSRDMEGITVPWSAIYSGGQAFRHRHTTNTAYIDGHIGASNQAFAGSDKTPNHTNLLQSFMDFPNNGFLSDDDSAYDPR